MTTIRLVALLTLGSLLVTGCSGEDLAESIAEEAAEQAAGGEVDIDSDDGSLSIESSEGSVQMGTGGSVPESFPDDLPLPDADYEVVNSFEQSGEDGLQLQVAVQTAAPVEDLVAYFEQALPEAGWEITDQRRAEMDELLSVTITATGDTHGALLMITADGEGQTLVNYGIGDPPS